VPIYEYEPDDQGCDYCKDGFEVMQSMSDKPLKKCPQCGRACHRVLSVLAHPPKNILSDANLADKGFTKYTRKSDGQYTKDVGPGPDLKTYE